MTDAFIADATIREMYHLKAGDTFASRFSAVSLESILFYIVASACYVVERLFDQLRSEVLEQIETSVVATLPWYYHLALGYQHGDTLVLDEATMRYRYASPDPSKQVVRYVAVTDRGGSIRMLVSGDSGGRPVPLSNDVLTAFKAYMNRAKIAGVVLSVQSLPADQVQVDAIIQIDPMVLRGDGSRLGDGSRPIEEAIARYLATITYGGRLNKTRLVDALQAVDGVLDIALTEVRAKPDGRAYKPVVGNNYTARSGCFDLDLAQSQISYVVQL